VLAAVCVAAFVVVRVAGRWLATGRARGAGAGLLAVVARVPLEPRRSLYIVDVAGKALLVGTSEMGLTVLSELDRERVHSVPPPASFAQMVRAAVARLGRRGGGDGDGDGGGDGRGGSAGVR
jgi:flagellar biogenesis protein FliO